jgi:hypothetical protein
LPLGVIPGGEPTPSSYIKRNNEVFIIFLLSHFFPYCFLLAFMLFFSFFFYHCYEWHSRAQDCANCHALFVLAHFLMGSLNPCTSCCYCASHLASHIPDGAAGPMCLVCMEEAAISPEHCSKIEYKRLLRLFAGLSALLAKSSREQLPIPHDASIAIAGFLWRS